jgi:glycosyltransferase involved in cell wall biosynthesis
MNPWSLTFLQVLLYRRLFCPQAKIICTIKKNTYNQRRGIFGIIKRLLVRFTLARVDHVLAASQMVKELFIKQFQMSDHRISVCPYLGLDVTFFSPGERNVDQLANNLIVGYCGRFDEEKGISDLVNAMRTVNRSRESPVKLRLVGCGSYGGFLDEYLQHQARELPWIEVYPPVSNAEVAAFLRTLDIFVMPARIAPDHQEHDGRALLEAMASGLACISTVSGIVPELFADNSGYLVKPSSPSELTAALEILLAEPEERLRIGKQARSKAVREFGLNTVAQRTLEIFRGVLHGNI